MKGAFRRIFFDLMYRLGKPAWDTGITPPEVVRTIEQGQTPGRALDLGCGTGTNSVYLVQHGWQVVGVDFSPRAIALARRKADRARVSVDLRVGDVTRLDTVAGPFDYVLDIGCFHMLDAAGRERYAQQLARLVRPEGMFMLYAFERPAPSQGDSAPAHPLVGVFSQDFEMTHVEHGGYRGRATAWYWFKRKS